MTNIKVELAKKIVDDLDLYAEFIMHEKTGRTTVEAEKALGVSADHILKTLILYASKENKFIGAIILGTDKIDTKKIAKIAKVKKLRFANNDQISNITGFDIGGVPPFAVKNCNDYYIDADVLKKDFVIGAGGDEHFGMKFSPKDLADKIKIKVDKISI